MKFTRIFAVFSVAAAVFAAPSVNLLERTTPTNVINCNQSNGLKACCDTSQKQVPIAQALKDFNPSAGLASLIALVISLLPNLTAGVAVQCTAIGVVAPSLNLCSTPNTCCATAVGANSNPSSFIQLLSNNQLTICPSIAT